ncbi:RsbRD N-terminal domain-containing protein [Candidatus Zixiibacteriota bacterium]
MYRADRPVGDVPPGVSWKVGIVALDRLLREKKDQIVQQWVTYVLQTYPDEGARLFESEKDPFANPVGASVRNGVQMAFDALLEGEDAESISRHLSEIIQIRAVQQFSASEGLSFVFRLKDAVRDVLKEAAIDHDVANEWRDLDRKIDEMALASFDIHGEYRKQVYELRLNETKRRVSWVIDKMNQRDGLAEPDLADPVENAGER